jgi:DNA-binding GntR family transcriptional regulator
MTSPDAATRDGQNVALVHEQLRTAILAGEIPPGQATSQIVLARELGVGRTPLREALRMLQHEGLVVSQPNRRVRIAEVSVVDLEELYIMRIPLEAVAARITVPTLTSEDHAELEGLMAQMDHLAEAISPQLNAAHRAFHLRFVAAAGDRPVTMIGQLFDHAERYRRVYGFSVPGHWNKRREEHRLMVDRAQAGDAEGTAEAIAQHYLRTAKTVAAALDESYKLDRLRTAVLTVAPGAASVLD